MVIYTSIVAALILIGFGAKLSEQDRDHIWSVIDFFLFVPIFGRIFGWW